MHPSVRPPGILLLQEMGTHIPASSRLPACLPSCRCACMCVVAGPGPEGQPSAGRLPPLLPPRPCPHRPHQHHRGRAAPHAAGQQATHPPRAALMVGNWWCYFCHITFCAVSVCMRQPTPPSASSTASAGAGAAAGGRQQGAPSVRQPQQRYWPGLLGGGRHGPVYGGRKRGRQAAADDAEAGSALRHPTSS